MSPSLPPKLERILAQLDEKDRVLILDRLHSRPYGQWEFNAELLADSLTASGYPISASLITAYRRRKTRLESM